MKDLLKFITCGSVDDGKSTLIGHILYDSKLLYADQEKALELDSKVGSRGGEIDYSLLLDGLMAEREQGITIDVAYRYFTTDHRSFIVADTPGHEEYTRNMAVGASFADLSIILVDAKYGVQVQTRRHARICNLMGIKHFVYAVNKMDLVGYSEDRYNEIHEQIESLNSELGITDYLVIPLSATEGDNLTSKSTNTPWYQGQALLPYLEQKDVNVETEEGFYLPVQRVCRPNHTFRGFQGQIEAGSLSVGDEITVLPNQQKAIVKTILLLDEEVETVFKGQPVTVQLDREVDVSRGCVLVKGIELEPVRKVKANLLWMDDSVLKPGKDYLIKVGTKLIPSTITDLSYKIDVNSGEQKQANQLLKNEIASCEITISDKVVANEFAAHKTLGELILIDRVTNMTAACGVIEKVIDDAKTSDYAFVHGDISIEGDIFEEFYYNIENLTVHKYKEHSRIYTIGDEIPIKGNSYHYPDFFDIISVDDQAVIHVRERKITDIIPISSYQYSGLPLIDNRGFAIKITSSDTLRLFIDDYSNADEGQRTSLANKYLSFEAYRSIIFNDNFWII